MATGDIKDPYLGGNFLVEIDGISRGAFQQVSGFDSTVSITEYREGNDIARLRKLPGMVSYSNLQLRWGMADDRDLYDWHLAAVKGDVQRKNGSIVLMDRRGTTEVARWNFVRAWPTVYNGPDLDAQTENVAIEMLELAHEGLERA